MVEEVPFSHPYVAKVGSKLVSVQEGNVYMNSHRFQ